MFVKLFDKRVRKAAQKIKLITAGRSSVFSRKKTGRVSGN